MASHDEHEETTNDARPALAAKLGDIYDEMRARQLRAIRDAGSFRSDPYFVPDARRANADDGGGGGEGADAGTADGEADGRRCLAISSVIDASVTALWTAAYLRLVRMTRQGRLDDALELSACLLSPHLGHSIATWR